MISVTFYKDNRLVLGVKTNKGILDVEVASSKFPYINNIPKTVSELISRGESAKQGLLRLIDISLMEDSLFFWKIHLIMVLVYSILKKLLVSD